MLMLFWQTQLLAEMFERLVARETRLVGRYLEQYSARRAEIDRPEIVAVNDRRDLVARIDECRTDLQLACPVLDRESDVMYRSGTLPGNRRAGQRFYLDEIGPVAVGHRETRDAVPVLGLLVTHEAQQLARRTTVAQAHRDIAEAADCGIGRNVCFRPDGAIVAIGLDKRIGPKFLHAGPGFGGSCFPKDTRAFAATGKRYGARQTLIEQVIDINEARKTAMAERVLENLDNPSHSTVAVLGIAFKPNTDDIREAPSLAIIGRLLDAGVTVRAHDPEAMENAQKVLDRVTFCDTELEAATGADAVVIVTEWNAYRGMDLGKLAGAMRGDKLIDLRNVFQPQDVDAAGLKLSGVGHR